MRSDLLIKNVAVVSFDNKDSVLENQAVLIRDGRIAWIAPAESDAAAGYDGACIDGRGMVATPGLVDSHFHTAQQFERGMLTYLSRSMRLQGPIWKNYLIPFESSLSEDDLALSAELAYANLIKVGTTCFADAGGPTPGIFARVMEKTGIRGILCRSTLDMSDGIPDNMHDTIDSVCQKSQALYDDWHNAAEGRIRVWMGMRQITVCSEPLLLEVKRLAAALGTGIHIHLAEGQYEVEYTLGRHDLRPAEYLHKIGFFEPGVLAAHSVLLSRRELDILRDDDVAVAHCPQPAYTGIGPCRVPELLDRGVRIGLGTDGALTGSLDLLQKMWFSYTGQITNYGTPYYDRGVTTSYQMLRMATRGGAEALRWSDEIGSLEVGKQADILLFSLDHLDALPAYDITYTVTDCLSASHLDTVIIAGRPVMRGKKLLTVDEDALRQRVLERRTAIIDNFLEKSGQKRRGY